MVLPDLYIFSNFIAVNQLYINNYGTTEEAYYKVYRRGGEGTQEASEIKENQQDIARTHRGLAAAGCCPQRPHLALRDRWHKIRHVAEHGAYCGKALRPRWACRGADTEKESQLRFSKHQDGWPARGPGIEHCLWSRSGGKGQMDTPASGGAVPCRAGRASEQGYHQESFKKTNFDLTKIPTGASRPKDQETS